MHLRNKTVVVIGGSSGIGKGIADRALRNGARVIVTSRDAGKLDGVVRQSQWEGLPVEGHVIDAADADSIAAFFAEIGSFDHLVSMAGGFMGGGFLDAPYEVVHRAVEEKLFANLRVARQAAHHIAEGGSMTFTGGSGGRPHNASGAILGNRGIRTLVQGLAIELSPKARANAVAPTWTDTPLWDGMPAADREATKKQFSDTIPLGRTAEIDELVSAYAFLMECSFITGQTIVVDGGLSLI